MQKEINYAYPDCFGTILYKLTMQNIKEFLPRKHCKERALKMLKTMQIYQKCIFGVFIVFFAIFSFF